jgi:hypothetical protein
LNAAYHGSSTQKFHEELQRGVKPRDAAVTILTGIQKNKARIMISDGGSHDRLARLLPASYVGIVRLLMWWRKIDIR